MADECTCGPPTWRNGSCPKTIAYRKWVADRQQVGDPACQDCGHTNRSECCATITERMVIGRGANDG